jgi:hypothetical protein
MRDVNLEPGVPDLGVGAALQEGLDVSGPGAVFATRLDPWSRKPGQPDIAVAGALRGNVVGGFGREPLPVEHDRLVDATRGVQMAKNIRRPVPDHEWLASVSLNGPLIGTVGAAVPDVI